MAKPKIYIIEIELENIESHEHTVLKGFSPGFNCIAGMSNVGKSTVIRAVKLCAYNTFDQAMVRTGADYCRVKITTNIGYVEVKKGKDVNLWIVKRNDTKGEIKLDKVGKAEVKQACDVLGMKVIQLGETEVPINIMDQLERHFFIDGIGDKKTTGSSRAEIIDEICGLNGAEELIRAISLDQYRLTREITEAENRIKEIEGKLYSEADILKDQILLAKIEKLEEEIGSCETNISFMNQIISSYKEIETRESDVISAIESIPDIDAAESLCRVTKEDLASYQKQESLWKSYSQSGSKIDGISASISEIPQLEGINLEDARDSALKATRCSSIYGKYEDGQKTIQEVCQKLLEIPDLENLTSLLGKEEILLLQRLTDTYKEYSILIAKISEIDERLLSVAAIEEAESLLDVRDKIAYSQALSARLEAHLEVCHKIQAVSEEILKTEGDIIAAENGLSKIYSEVTICPVTKLPIGDTCSLIKKRETTNGCTSRS